MIGVIVATHGEFSVGLLNALELIMGKQEKVETMCLTHETSIEEFSVDMLNHIKTLDSGEGVVVFTDLYSASPYNQAALNYKNLQDVDYRIISGVNLPMLVEGFNQRMLGASLDEVATLSMETAKEGIKEFFNEMKQNEAK